MMGSPLPTSFHLGAQWTGKWTDVTCLDMILSQPATTSLPWINIIWWDGHWRVVNQNMIFHHLIRLSSVSYLISKQRRQDSIQYQYIVTWCKLTCHAWRSYSSIALCFLRHLPSNMIQLHKFGTIHVQGAHSRGNRSHIILFWVMTDVEHLEAKRSVTWIDMAGSWIASRKRKSLQVFTRCF